MIFVAGAVAGFLVRPVVSRISYARWRRRGQIREEIREQLWEELDSKGLVRYVSERRGGGEENG